MSLGFRAQGLGFRVWGWIIVLALAITMISCMVIAVAIKLRILMTIMLIRSTHTENNSHLIKIVPFWGLGYQDRPLVSTHIGASFRASRMQGCVSEASLKERGT